MGCRFQIDLRQFSKRAVVLFFQPAPIEVLGHDLVTLCQFQTDKMHRGQPGRILHGDGRHDAVFHAVDGGCLLPAHGAVQVQDFDLRGQAPGIVAAVIHHFNVVRRLVPLNVQWLRRLLGAKIGRRRLEVVVVGLPDKRRPRRMAHPKEYPHPILALGFEHGAVPVVIDELGEFHPVGRVVGAAITLLNHVAERSASLRATQREVVNPPNCTLGPEVPFRHHLFQAVERHDVRHPQFAVQSFSRPLFEIEFQRHGLIRTAATDPSSGRVRDVAQSWMQRRHHTSHPVVERFGRVSLVTAAVEPDGRVVANPLHEIGNVRHEKVVVPGVGTVERIRQPKILPHHDPILIRRLIKGIVARLADPVPDHGEVHFLVVAHRYVVFARAISQHGLGKAPVAAPTHKPAAVDPDLQCAALVAVGELPYPGLERLCIRDSLVRGLERQFHVVEIGFSISRRPPQFRTLQPQRRRGGGIGLYRCAGSRGHRHLLCKRHAAESPAQCPRHRLLVVVAESGFHTHVGAASVRQRQSGRGKRLLDGDRPAGGQVDIAPDAAIPPANRRYPIPADGRMKRRIVRTQRTAVFVWSIERFFLYAPRRRILPHQNCDGVLSSRPH